MKNKKAIGLVLSLALILGMALPGTLAASADTTGADSEFSIGTMKKTELNTTTPLENVENNADKIPAAEDGAAIDTSTCTCGAENGVHAEGCPLYEAPSEPVCSCGTQNGVHAEDCPLYEVPSEPVCSCGTQDGVHTEGCPLYTDPIEPEHPEKPAHIDTCVEGCTGEDCECPCHKLSLFERLMACETLDELFAIVDATPENELMTLTDEENTEIEAKIAALEGEPLPPVLLEKCVNESVISEIIYPAVNFDNVAPFGAPVEG